MLNLLVSSTHDKNLVISSEGMRKERMKRISVVIKSVRRSRGECGSEQIMTCRLAFWRTLKRLVSLIKAEVKTLGLEVSKSLMRNSSK